MIGSKPSPLEQWLFDGLSGDSRQRPVAELPMLVIAGADDIDQEMSDKEMSEENLVCILLLSELDLTITYRNSRKLVLFRAQPGLQSSRPQENVWNHPPPLEKKTSNQKERGPSLSLSPAPKD